MNDPVVHFEIAGPDGAALQSFYADIFGWSIDASNPMGYGIVGPADGGIGGGVTGTEDGSAGHATFYVQVDDPHASLQRIEAAGGRTVVPVTEVPGMVTFAMFTDPQGNLVGLVKG
jgi:predicted enzyme related to lactoylglutathione lyase